MMFSRLVMKYRHLVDLLLSHTDGSHTQAVRGDESVEYQGRKKRKTTNSIYFTDRHVLPSAMSEPQKGNHTDLYEIMESLVSFTFQLGRCGISLDGIFNNADAAFDPRSFRQALDKYGIIANVCPKTRNGKSTEEYLFD